MTRALVLLALSSLAHADTSIATPASDFDPKKCSMGDAPYRRAWSDATVIKAQPDGLHPHQAPGRHHALYSTGYFDPSPRSVAVDLRSQKPVASIPEEEAALVEGDDGELVGVLGLGLHDAGRHLSLFVDGKERWPVRPHAEAYFDNAATLVAGKLLVVSLFDRIATGASLIGLDLDTGAVRWEADVVQMNVDHSKYFNDVSLERRGDVIVMRGYEAAGCYQQTFDLSTGKRLSSTIR